MKRAVYAFVSLDSIPLEPHFRAARQTGTIEDEPYDEGMFLLGLQAAERGGCRSCPPASASARTCSATTRAAHRRCSPYDDGETLVAAPALRLDAALVHLNRADARGNAGYLGPDPYFDDLFVGAAEKAYVSAEYVVPTDDLEPTVGLTRLLINRLHVDRRGRGDRRGPLHLVRARLRARRGVPEVLRGVGEVAGGMGRVQGGLARSVRGRLPGQAAARPPLR